MNNQNAEEVRGLSEIDIRTLTIHIQDAKRHHHEDVRVPTRDMEALLVTIADRDATITAQAEQIERLKGEVEEMEAEVELHRIASDGQLKLAERYYNDRDTLQTELHDVRQAVLTAFAPTRFPRHDGVPLKECQFCEHAWIEGEAEIHAPNCIVEFCSRQALAAESTGDDDV